MVLLIIASIITIQEYRLFWCPMKIKKIKVDNSDY